MCEEGMCEVGMVTVDSTKNLRQRLRNIFHSVLIIGAMVLLLGLAIELVLGPGGWWLLLAIVLGLFMSTRLSPLLVMRLYNAQALQPHMIPVLHSMLATLAERAGLSILPSLHYIPSNVPIAFTAGTNANSAIALSEGALRHLNQRELAAVLAHEISHIRHRDIWVMSLADNISRMTVLLSLFGFMVLVILTPILLLSGEFPPLLAMLILALAPNITTLLQLALSRTREFDADLGAAELTRDPEAMISALQKLDNPSPSWLSRLIRPQHHDPNPSLLRSHPATEERVRRLNDVLIKTPTTNPVASDYAIPPVPGRIVVTRKPRRHWHGLWY